MKLMQTKRANKLVKLLKRLIKQEHLFSEERIKEMKSQLEIVEKQIKEVELQTFRGFRNK